MQDVNAGLRELRRLQEAQLRVFDELERAVHRMDEAATRSPEAAKAKRPTVNGSGFLRPTEVAEIMRVSPKTVYMWISTGQLKALDLGHRTKRVRGDEFKRFLREHAEDP
jgi:excisionase family DNA binding protein